MFLGNIGKAQNCDQMIKAVNILSNRNDIALHFVGDGSEKENLEKLVDKLGIKEKVYFHGRHPLSEVINFYDFADVCILALTSNTITGVTPPGKLYGYMAAGRCVIGALEGAGKRLIEQSDCGICVKPDSIEELAKAIRWAADNKRLIIEKGIHGRQYFMSHMTLKEYISQLMTTQQWTTLDIFMA